MSRYEIADFTRKDAVEYVRSFADAYGADIEPESFLDELQERGFADFMASPLMLALTCLLKADDLPTLPRTTIGLISRAVDTLTFRLDASKGLHRESRIPLDGYDRVGSLKRIAFGMDGMFVSDVSARETVATHLKLLQRGGVEPAALLLEMAQWYGLLVPASGAQWTFVHRSIQDFLAARFWVDNGGFRPAVVRTWNARAAYAACFLPDATKCVVAILRGNDELHAFVECLGNSALFDTGPVADAILEHYTRPGQARLVESSAMSITGTLREECFDLMSDALLLDLVCSVAARAGRTTEVDAVATYAVTHMRRRGLEVPANVYNQLLVRYGHHRFAFRTVKEGGRSSVTRAKGKFSRPILLSALRERQDVSARRPNRRAE